MSSLVLLFLILFLLIITGVFFLTLLGFFWSKFSVPFIPTNTKTLQKMVAIATISPSDTAVDLGCGDGRLVLAAERAGAKQSIGIEISPFVFLLAKINIFFRGKGKSTVFFWRFSQKRICKKRRCSLCFFASQAHGKNFFGALERPQARNTPCFSCVFGRKYSRAA